MPSQSLPTVSDTTTKKSDICHVIDVFSIVLQTIIEGPYKNLSPIVTYL